MWPSALVVAVAVALLVSGVGLALAALHSGYDLTSLEQWLGR